MAGLEGGEGTRFKSRISGHGTVFVAATLTGQNVQHCMYNNTLCTVLYHRTWISEGATIQRVFEFCGGRRQVEATAG